MVSPLPVFSSFRDPQIQMEYLGNPGICSIDDPGQRPVVEPGKRYGSQIEAFQSTRTDGSHR
jgi:hypothetical protein